MKTCPQCQAVLFADMATCFGCMYRFDAVADLDEDFLGVVDDEAERASACSGESGALPPAPAVPSSAGFPAPMPVTFAPSVAGSLKLLAGQPMLTAAQPRGGDWLVRIEMRNTENPQQVWSMELTPSCWGLVEAG